MAIFLVFNTLTHNCFKEFIMHAKSLALAVTAAFGLAVAAAPASATTYDFDPISGDTFTNGGTPVTLSGASFSTPTTGATFLFGASNGSFLTLGTTALFESSSIGAELTISFAQAQTGLSFDYAVEDGFGLNGNDALTVTTNTGFTENVTATLSSNPNALFPESLFTLAGGQPFTSITLAASDASGAQSLAIGNLASTPVPVPGALLLLGSGLLGLGGFGFARRAANA
jgi:hypothetical protein